MFANDLFEQITTHETAVAVVGLGYVGLPLAIMLAKSLRVIGFDINSEKIAQYQSGVDPTGEVGSEALRETSLIYTCDASLLRGAKFIIVSVPTPITIDKMPDLYPIESATRLIGRNISSGSVIVYESTVYPGVTEDICMPLLEAESGLRCGTEFKVGYSPERINPGDKLNRVDNIVKLVSGMDGETLELIALVYGLVVKAGVHRAESIKVAEAAKVVENSQRDINIAFMNEMSIVFHRLGIDTQAVLRAMATKWNALSFSPGLVGGHCIGIDSYYFIHRAEQLGYHSQFIRTGREVNEEMSAYVTTQIVKCLVKADRRIKGAKVVIYGLTFKENCPDIRNTKVIDVVNGLRDYAIDVLVVDPLVPIREADEKYGIKLTRSEEAVGVDAAVFAVPHKAFKSISLAQIRRMHSKGVPVLIDLKGVFDKDAAGADGMVYWSL